jgi:hypothetical protein
LLLSPFHRVNGYLTRAMRHYQRQGVAWCYSQLVRHSGCILADDMGLGKSVQTVALISALLGKTGVRGDDDRVARGKKRRCVLPGISRVTEAASAAYASWVRSSGAFARVAGNELMYAAGEVPLPATPILLVVPKSLVGNWQRELDTWGWFSHAALSDQRSREAKLARIRDAAEGRLEIVIATHAAATQSTGADASILDALHAVTWGLLVVDEVHLFRNPATIGHKSLEAYTAVAVLGLTGTPLQNTISDAFHLAKLCYQHLQLTLRQFEEVYALPIDAGRRKSASAAAEEAAARAELAFARSFWRRFYLHRLKRSVLATQLPGKREMGVYCRMGRVQEAVYKAALASRDFVNLAATVERSRHMKAAAGGSKRALKDALAATEEEEACTPRSSRAGCLWRAQHADASAPGGYFECAKCPGWRCMIWPCFSMLRNIANHVELAKPETDGGRSPLYLHWRRSFVEELLQHAAELLGGPSTAGPGPGVSAVTGSSGSASMAASGSGSRKMPWVKATSARAGAPGVEFSYFSALGKAPGTEGFPLPPSTASGGAAVACGLASPSAGQDASPSAQLQSSPVRPGASGREHQRLLMQLEERRSLLSKKVGGSGPASHAVTLGDLDLCGKLGVISRILDRAHRDRTPSGRGSKVLIFSRSVRFLSTLTAFFALHGRYLHLTFDGSLNAEQRHAVVTRFERDPAVFVLLVSLKAGGVGLNLVAANIVILADADWNPANSTQAQDRAYRIGQVRDVTVYRLHSLGTVEEVVYLRQVHKSQGEARAVSGAQTARVFDVEDIKGLRPMLSYRPRGFETRFQEQYERRMAAEGGADCDPDGMLAAEIEESNTIPGAEDGAPLGSGAAVGTKRLRGGAVASSAAASRASEEEHGSDGVEDQIQFIRHQLHAAASGKGRSAAQGIDDDDNDVAEGAGAGSAAAGRTGTGKSEGRARSSGSGRRAAQEAGDGTSPAVARRSRGRPLKADTAVLGEDDEALQEEELLAELENEEDSEALPLSPRGDVSGERVRRDMAASGRPSKRARLSDVTGAGATGAGVLTAADGAGRLTGGHTSLPRAAGARCEAESEGSDDDNDAGGPGQGRDGRRSDAYSDSRRRSGYGGDALPRGSAPGVTQGLYDHVLGSQGEVAGVHDMGRWVANSAQEEARRKRGIQVARQLERQRRSSLGVLEAAVAAPPLAQGSRMRRAGVDASSTEADRSRRSAFVEPDGSSFGGEEVEVEALGGAAESRVGGDAIAAAPTTHRRRESDSALGRRASASESAQSTRLPAPATAGHSSGSPVALRVTSQLHLAPGPGHEDTGAVAAAVAAASIRHAQAAPSPPRRVAPSETKSRVSSGVTSAGSAMATASVALAAQLQPRRRGLFDSDDDDDESPRGSAFVRDPTLHAGPAAIATHHPGTVTLVAPAVANAGHNAGLSPGDSCGTENEDAPGMD